MVALTQKIARHAASRGERRGDVRVWKRATGRVRRQEDKVFSSPDRVRDISLGGAAIYTSEPLQPGTFCNLTIKMAGHFFGLRATARWSTPHKETGYLTGFRFEPCFDLKALRRTLASDPRFCSLKPKINHEKKFSDLITSLL